MRKRRFLSIILAVAMALTMSCGVFAEETAPAGDQVVVTDEGQNDEGLPLSDEITGEQEVITPENPTEPTEPTAPKPQITGPNAKMIPIITYHHLCKASKYKRIRKYKSLYVTDKKFNQQMKWLKDNGWRTISSQELAQWYDGEIALPKKSVYITFDDGDYSVIKYGLPILKKYGQRATLFCVGNMTKATTNKKAFGGDKYHEVGMDVINSVRASYPKFEFQSHTYRMHSRINGKKPVTVMTTEQITQDCVKMNELLGECTAIAYPWGTYNGKMLTALNAAGGYKIGVTYGNYGTGYATRAQNRFALKRFKVNGKESLKTFKKRFTNIK